MTASTSSDTAPDPAQVLDAAFARTWTSRFRATFADQVALLADLDRRAGDGDFGANLTAALSRAQAFVDADDPQTFADVFFAVSKGFLNTGGTSGPLFGMWFREIAKAADGPGTTRTLATGVSRGLAIIQRLAGAQVGDSTMVDAIEPAARALAGAAEADAPIGRALEGAAAAATAGARSTRDLLAGRGRASYVGEVARGVLDPGAVAVALFFAAGASAASGSVPDTTWLRGAAPGHRQSGTPSVLFVCVHNAGRSQMAAGYLRHLAGDAVEVRSAGSEPADRVNPVAVEAMAEEGIDITAEQPKLLRSDAVQASDVVITMGCGDSCPYYPGKRYEDWVLDDPAGRDLATVRAVRDEIRGRVEQLVHELLT